MSFEATVLEPIGSGEPRAVVGLYPLPFDANMRNSGDRLQTLADNVGFPIIVSDLVLQSKKVIFYMKARQANQPSGDVYRDMSRRRADFFEKYAEQFPGTTRIGLGDSLCVPVVQGMQLHAEERPFDALLLRDGWNLDPRGNRIVGGMTRYIGYTLRDQLQQMKRTDAFDITDYGWSRTDAVPDETSLREKLVNVADLMRGPENRRNALALAMSDRMVMNVVCFDHGLSGTLPQTKKFIKDLYNASEHATDSRLKAEVVPGWHSDVLDPTRAAADIEQTLQLITSGR